MAFYSASETRGTFDFTWNELTGALGDSITVLPLVVAMAALTELSIGAMLVWFGIFQIVWGVYYGAPLSVEPMKALTALAIAGALTIGELVIAGLLAGVVLLFVGTTGTLARVERYLGDPVIRGIQLAVALVLLETGVRLSLTNLPAAWLALGVVGVVSLLGYRRASPLVVLALGGGLAVSQTGVPSVEYPVIEIGSYLSLSALTVESLEAVGAQLAMTVGNAAIATSVLMADFFDRDISADELSTSMGVTNLVAVPFGGLPMCHGSGGVAGKYAFGARTAGANILLGLGYLVVAIGAVSLVAAFPMALLGVILVLIAAQLAAAGLKTSHLPLTVGIGVVGLAVNIGAAFLGGAILYLGWRFWNSS